MVIACSTIYIFFDHKQDKKNILFSIAESKKNLVMIDSKETTLW